MRTCPGCGEPNPPSARFCSACNGAIEPVVSEPQPTRYDGWFLLIVGQLVVAGTVAFGDIGFDRAGSYGLDFGHLLLLAAVYALLFVAGLIVFIRKRRWMLLGFQFVLAAFEGWMILEFGGL